MRRLSVPSIYRGVVRVISDEIPCIDAYGVIRMPGARVKNQHSLHLVSRRGINGFPLHGSISCRRSLLLGVVFGPISVYPSAIITRHTEPLIGGQ